MNLPGSEVLLGCSTDVRPCSSFGFCDQVRSPEKLLGRQPVVSAVERFPLPFLKGSALMSLVVFKRTFRLTSGDLICPGLKQMIPKKVKKKQKARLEPGDARLVGVDRFHLYLMTGAKHFTKQKSIHHLHNLSIGVVRCRYGCM